DIPQGRGIDVRVVPNRHYGAVEARAHGWQPVVLEGSYKRSALLLLALVEKRPDAVRKGAQIPSVGRRCASKAVAVVERRGPEAARVSKCVAGDVTDSTILIRRLEIE